MSNKSWIDVVLENGHPAGSRLAYSPGALLQGEVHIAAPEDIIADKLHIQLVHYVQGHSDHVPRFTLSALSNPGQTAWDETMVMGDLYEDVLLKQHSSQTFPFVFRLPDGPWSFSGRLINIEWAVAVRIERENSEQEIIHRELFILSFLLEAMQPPRNDTASYEQIRNNA